MATTQQKLEIVRCGRDPIYFMKKYCRVRTPVGGNTPFRLWPFQEECINDFMRHRLNIVLKARQLGLSTVTAVYALWMAIFQKDRSILVIATKLSTAINFIKKVKFALQNLPPWLVLPKLAGETKSQLTFSNGSEITATPTSEDAGRSEALSLLIIDEAAWIKNFEDIWTGLQPTISTGGRAILLSTPNGVGGQYYKLWTDAVAELNDFNHIKLMWDVRPDHDQEWFEKETRGMGKRKIAQEYLCDFLSSGETFLQPDDLDWLRKHIKDPIEKKGFDRGVWVWAHPKALHRYVISSDVARGTSGDKGDYSTFHVIDCDECEVVAEYMGRVPPDKLGDLLNEFGLLYNKALIAPENNTFGFSTCTRLRDHHKYPRLYYKDAVGDAYDYRPYSDDEVPGFPTQGNTRPQILTKLEELIRNRIVRIYSRRFCDQMQAFVWAGAKAQAGKDSHDDLVISLAIGSWLLDCIFGGGVRAGASRTAMLAAVTVTRRDVSTMPSTTVTALVDPRIVASLQHAVYGGVRRMPKPGALNDFSWLGG